MKKSNFRWGRFLRQGCAVFMAVIAVWLVLAGARAAGTAGTALSDSAGFVTSALHVQLGAYGQPDGDVFGRLLSGQSALLRENVTAAQAQTQEDGMQPAGQSEPMEHDDISVPPEGNSESANVTARTLLPNAAEAYANYDGVYVYNRTGLSFDLATIASAPIQITLEESEEPQILIMHTHGTEAYTMDGDDIYTPSDENTRTVDENYNVVRIGDEMQTVFEEMGFAVIHDKTLYDYPAYSGSYGRSEKGIEEYLAEYPSIRIVLDVHRDALVGADGTVYKAVTEIDGEQTAQVMMVMGSNETTEHAKWQENLSLAVRIQEEMNTLYPTLARPVTLRSSTYNQQLTNGSLLVEVGSHGNTLQEAIRGARLYAEAAGKVLQELEA
ncbi:MAG: stage II sporulation protein P [Oscillospiraceae bacterium]|nr:stage II sporulation protein P [Oscillospiraceae bacterium]